jgi:hypothetical protein
LHHATLLRAESMRTAIGLAMFSKDLRELQPPRPRLGVRGLAHGSGAGLLRQRQEIERRSRAFQVALRQVEIAHRGRDVPVPEETLDAVEIDPGLQEMGGEGVSQAMDPALLPDPRLFFGVVIDLLG